jgi:hypothetical protein
MMTIIRMNTIPILKITKMMKMICQVAQVNTEAAGEIAAATVKNQEEAAEEDTHKAAIHKADTRKITNRADHGADTPAVEIKAAEDQADILQVMETRVEDRADILQAMETRVEDLVDILQAMEIRVEDPVDILQADSPLEMNTVAAEIMVHRMVAEVQIADHRTKASPEEI